MPPEAELLNCEIPENWFPPKYDPDNDPHFDIDETVLVLGERRSGKTTWQTEMLLRRRRLYPCVFVFTQTRANNYWQQYVPAKKIADNLDDEVLRKIIDDNTERFTEWKLIKHNTGKYKGNPIVKIVFEDMISEDALRKSKVLQRVCYNGRHHALSVDILSQDYVGMKRGERDNMDRWVIFRPDSGAVLNWLRESLGPRVMEIAKQVWAKGAMFILNRKKRIPLMERMYWYESDMCYITAATHKNLCLGNAAWWAGVDVRKQKQKYPCVEYPALATLESKFNEPIEKDSENTLDDIDGSANPETKNEVIESKSVTNYEVTSLLKS